MALQCMDPCPRAYCTFVYTLIVCLFFVVVVFRPEEPNLSLKCQETQEVPMPPEGVLFTANQLHYSKGSLSHLDAAQQSVSFFMYLTCSIQCLANPTPTGALALVGYQYVPISKGSIYSLFKTLCCHSSSSSKPRPHTAVYFP